MILLLGCRISKRSHIPGSMNIQLNSSGSGYLLPATQSLKAFELILPAEKFVLDCSLVTKNCSVDPVDGVIRNLSGQPGTQGLGPPKCLGIESHRAGVLYCLGWIEVGCK